MVGSGPSQYQENEHTLAGELIKMRDQMKLAKQDDEQRFWINEAWPNFPVGAKSPVKSS